MKSKCILKEVYFGSFSLYILDNDSPSGEENQSDLRETSTLQIEQSYPSGGMF